MVTLNTEVLEMFSPVIVFILVFVFLYAVLVKLEFLSKNKGVNGLIAFSMAFLFIIFPLMKEVLMEAMPWIVVAFLCIVVIMVILMFMGYKQESIVEWMKDNSFGTVVTIIVSIIFIGALTKVFSAPGAQEAMGGLDQIRTTLLNPKVLGAVIILIIAAKVMHAVGFEK